jgi:hypothetical protein
MARWRWLDVGIGLGWLGGIAVREYIPAIGFLSLAIVAVISQIWHWRALIGHRPKIVFTVMILLVYWGGLKITLSEKGDDAWSHLLPIVLPDVYQHALVPEIVVKTDAQYPQGSVIAGLPWIPGSIEATVKLSTASKMKLLGVELQLKFDALMMHGAPLADEPHVILQPLQRSLIGGFEAGGLDKNGKEISRYTATPQDVALLNSYPTDTFVYKEAEAFPDLPVTLVFVSGNGYQLGNFTYQTFNGPLTTRNLEITGQYTVQYKSKSWVVPVKLSIKPRSAFSR